MITSAQVESLKLGIAPIDDKTILTVESAFNWIADNTTLEIDLNDEKALEALPANVRLFVVQYFDIMSMRTGVASESIEGLSQSYSNETKKALIEQAAETLLDKWLKSKVRFVTAQKRW